MCIKNQIHRMRNPEYRIQPRHRTSGCAWTRKLEKGDAAVGATPTAGDRDGRDPRKVGKGGKWGVGRRLETCFHEKWLCSITRIYTLLHAFTQSFWRVTLTREMECWSRGVMDCRRVGAGRSGRGRTGSGKRWECGEERGQFFPPFRTISRHFPPFPT